MPKHLVVVGRDHRDGAAAPRGEEEPARPGIDELRKGREHDRTHMATMHAPQQERRVGIHVRRVPHEHIGSHDLAGVNGAQHVTRAGQMHDQTVGRREELVQTLGELRLVDGNHHERARSLHEMWPIHVSRHLTNA